MAEHDGGKTLVSTPPVNVNVGVMGHVDSGKTNLVRVLSTQLSTAALDKHPQSQQRGITLDLGFSAFRLPPLTQSEAAVCTDGGNASKSLMPSVDSLKTDQPGGDIQITLVDCPGHASLFKTILGGARIIDMVLLVVDVQKGLQSQTIESLLVAELAVKHHVVIALNKVDLLPEQVRERRVRRVQSEIRAFLDRHFACFKDRSVPIIPVAAAPSTPPTDVLNGSDNTAIAQSPLGIVALVQAIRSHLHVPERDLSGPFSLAIDHCFAIQGNGTILTGTVLSGSVKIGDEIEIPSLQVVKKVKSMQMFKTSVAKAAQGDRVGIRVSGLDASLVERGMAITPHSMTFASQVVVPVHQITFFQGGSCKTGGKFHATIGHTTVVAVATFFSRIGKASSGGGDAAGFDPTCLYEHVAQIEPVAMKDDDDKENDQQVDSVAQVLYYALLQFDQPILCQPGALVVCSRLDLDPKKFACRLAFHGRVQAIVTTVPLQDQMGESPSSSSNPLSKQMTVPLATLRIGKIKSRDGVVDKADDAEKTRVVIGRDMFSKDVDWSVYANVTVLFEASQVLGKILGPFGKAGKFRIELIESSTRGRQLSIAGEKIILRFVKLVVLKAPVIKGKGGGGSRASSRGNNGASRSKAAGNLLQDDQLLYPEAFTLPPYNPFSVTEESAEGSRSSSSVSSKDPVDSMPLSSNLVVSEQIQGKIERLKGETTADGRNPFVIVTGLFASDQEACVAVGKQVVVVISKLPGVEEIGEIDKPFGKAGKVRVTFTESGGTLAQIGDKVRLLAAPGN